MFTWRLRILTIILFALVLVHRGHNLGHAKNGILGTSVGKNISDERSLASVCSENADLGCGIAEKAHVLENCHSILGLTKILHEVRHRHRFSFAFVVAYIDELVVVLKTSVCSQELVCCLNMRQVA